MNIDARATALFAATAIVTAIAVAGMQISGWRGGSLDNRIEPLFWAGAILGAVGIGILGIAAMPGGREATTVRLVRGGLGLILIAPVLCVVAVFTDVWI